jgi:hypothetical protein
MAKKTNTVFVKVTGQPVGEDGNHYAKGEVFETTPERAEALGTLVEITTAPAATEKDG